MGSTCPASLAKVSTCWVTQTPDTLQDASGGNSAKLSLTTRSLWAVMEMALCLSFTSSYTGQGHETCKCRLRAEFGPAAAWIAVCVPGSQALSFQALISGTVVGEWGIHHSKKSVLRTTAYVNINMRGRDKTPSWCREGVVTILATPMQGDPSISACEHWGGGISALPMSWTPLPPCPREGRDEWGSLGSAPIREEAFLCPSKPLVKDNQARCHRANSDGIKAVMKFTAGLASPSNGPAPQWHIVPLARM